MEGGPEKNYSNLTFRADNVSTDENHQSINSTDEEIWRNQAANTLLHDSYIIAAEQIRLYGIVTLVPIGLILNTLSFVVFYKIKKHKSALGSHIMCMAVADNCALLGIFAVFETFSEGQWIPTIQDVHIVLCKTSIPLGNAGSLWSGVLLASATVERYCSIAFPLKVRNWNSYKISKILNVIYLLASFSLNIPIAYSLHLGTEDNETICDFPPGGLTEIIEEAVNVILSHIIVTIIVFIFTVAIAVHLKKMENNRKTLSQNMVIRSSKEFVITTMLFAVACLFLVTRLPMVAVYETTRYIQSTGNYDLKTVQLVETAWPIAVLLLVINHSTNFVIYVIFFKEFRDKLVAMVTCKQNNNGTNLRRSSTRVSMVTANRIQQPGEIATIL